MRTIAAVIVFAMVTVLNGAAYAALFTITEGSMIFGGFDTIGDFSGKSDVFLSVSVSMSSATGIDTTEAFGVGIFSTGHPLGDEMGGATVTIEIGGTFGGSTTSCINTGSPIPCGTISFTSPKLETRPADWPSTVDFSATAPFTATGHFNLSDASLPFDFVGQGTLTGTVCSGNIPAVSPCNFGFGRPVLQYTFAVDEPPTLLLAVAALCVLGALFSIRVLRDRYTARLPEHP
jgi:hypothetical protein